MDNLIIYLFLMFSYSIYYYFFFIFSITRSNVTVADLRNINKIQNPALFNYFLNTLSTHQLDKFIIFSIHLLTLSFFLNFIFFFINFFHLSQLSTDVCKLKKHFFFVKNEYTEHRAMRFTSLKNVHQSTRSLNNYSIDTSEMRKFFFFFISHLLFLIY